MRNVVLYGDCLARLKEVQESSIQTCVTSPPYFGLRDYGIEGQIGMEATPDEYIAKLVDVFRAVRRVLRDDGTLWVNLGDSYANKKHAGCKPKDLIGIPWAVAFALRADGWYLRSDIVWNKPNPMPESVDDRPSRSHEYIFLLSKSKSYSYDADAIREPCSEESVKNFLGRGVFDNKTDHGASRPDLAKNRAQYMPEGFMRNKRTVWTINPKPLSNAHFATFPPELPTTCIKAGSKVGDLVLDPFAGSGTTLAAAIDLDRDFVGIELNEAYRPLIEDRINPALESASQRRNFQRIMEWSEEEAT